MITGSKVITATGPQDHYTFSVIFIIPPRHESAIFRLYVADVCQTVSEGTGQYHKLNIKF